jgi:hypothetical protein
MTIILLILAILCLAIGVGAAASPDMERGGRAFGCTLFVGLAVLLAWLALR